jgi:peptide/nickel transport system ATP-binding protein
MTITQEATSQAGGQPGALLEARGLTRHFVSSRGRGVVHAVDDASIALAPASITGLVGESGSGKSTLARLLAMLVPATSVLLVEPDPRCPLSPGAAAPGAEALPAGHVAG